MVLLLAPEGLTSRLQVDQTVELLLIILAVIKVSVCCLVSVGLAYVFFIFFSKSASQTAPASRVFWLKPCWRPA